MRVERSEPLMDAAPSHTGPEGDAVSARERLESWKEIAVYLKRSVRTLHRWEKEEGLPVHRQLHKDLGSVFAYKNERMPGPGRAASMPSSKATSRSEPGQGVSV